MVHVKLPYAPFSDTIRVKPGGGDACKMRASGRFASGQGTIECCSLFSMDWRAVEKAPLGAPCL